MASQEAPAAAAAAAAAAADVDAGPGSSPSKAAAAAAGSGSQGGGVVLPPTNNLAPARPWFSEPCLLGIDEAGRGPVLGAMVYAVVAAPISYRDTLAKQSYADSKTLTEAERSKLFKALAADQRCVYAADLLPARVISRQMLGRHKVSLNAIAEGSTVGLIQAMLDAGVNLTEVYVDTVGDPDRYRSRLSSCFPGLAFTVCPKADALYPAVSAASIVAKVLRDTSLLVEQQTLQQQQQQQQLGPGGEAGEALGNGYPSDPATQAWLSSHCDRVFGFPDVVRFSWETCSRLMEERCVKVTWPADAGAADGAGGAGGTGGGGGQQQTLACFKAPTNNSGETSGMGRHPYFRLRRMQRVAAF